MSERVIHANGVDLCIETFGATGDPAVLLIGGASASMDWWDDEFCARLAEDRHVIRYDLRDTGRSVASPAGEPNYTNADLAADALGILDALGIERAHIVGISMGGGIAQRIAVEHPERVASVTFMSTTPGGPGTGGDDLPPPEPQVLASFDGGDEPGPDLSTKEGLYEAFLAGERIYAGDHPIDEDALRTLSHRVFDRTTDVAASLSNHFLAESGAEPVRPRLAEITAPALVLHGTKDPLFPFAHAEALAREIPGAKLVALEGAGHQMPPRALWDVVLGEIRGISGGRTGARES